MIAFAGALRLAGRAPTAPPMRFDVRPRWPLEEIEGAAAREEEA
jgi:tRNA A37 threonylcarbamoyltransferase TsaD